jgi:hypothetical protein
MAAFLAVLAQEPPPEDEIWTTKEAAGYLCMTIKSVQHSTFRASAGAVIIRKTWALAAYAGGEVREEIGINYE